VSDSDSIPDDVRRFVLTSVPSVAYLEAILIFRAKSQDRLTPQDLSHSLYIEQLDAEALLKSLADAGIVTEENGAFMYTPEDPLRQTIDGVAVAYSGHLLGITKLIHDATQKHAHQFANAFKWRKE
jgi:hypothetical protein